MAGHHFWVGRKSRQVIESVQVTATVLYSLGTQKEPTPEPLRGKLLGMAEIGRLPVDTTDVIGDDVRSPHDFERARSIPVAQSNINGEGLAF